MTDREGTSVRGAEVVAYDARDRIVGRATAGAFGRFHLQLDGSPSTVRLEVGAPDWAEDPLRTAWLDDVPADQHEIQVTLQPGVWIQGVVLDADYGELYDVPVTLWPAQGFMRGALAHMRTKRDGSFRLAAAPGRYVVTAEPTSEKAAWPDPVEVEAPSEWIEIRCRRVCEIRGRLEGEDVGGYTVGWVCPGPTGDMEESSTWSAEDGSFVIDDAPTRVVTLYALKRGSALYGRVVVDTEHRDPVRLELAEGLELRGRFQPPTGRAVEERTYADAIVYARDPRLGFWIPGQVSRDGNFVITGLSPGRYELMGSARCGVVPHGLSAEAGDHQVEIVLSRP